MRSAWRWLLLLPLLALAWQQHDAGLLRFYPVLINAAFLAVFAGSLLRGMPVVERLARISEPDLPAAGVFYTRRVTQLWCVFFVLSGAVALYTALFASFAVWAWYNGAVSYLLMGLLYGGEWLYRQHYRKKHA